MTGRWKMCLLPLGTKSKPKGAPPMPSSEACLHKHVHLMSHCRGSRELLWCEANKEVSLVGTATRMQDRNNNDPPKRVGPKFKQAGWYRLNVTNGEVIKQNYNTYTHECTHMHKHKHMCVHTSMDAHTQTYSHVCVHMHTYANTHIHTHVPHLPPLTTSSLARKKVLKVRLMFFSSSASATP